MRAQESAPFPFMRLPKELRFMVALIYTASLPVGILATCHEIHKEAKPIVAEMMRQIASEMPQVDGQWDLPEFMDFMLKLYQNGPVLPTGHLKQRVAESFATLDSSTRKAIMKFLLYGNIYRQDHAIDYTSFSYRVVQIVSSEGFLEPHYAGPTTEDAWLQLRRNAAWNEERDFMLSKGEEDIGLATHRHFYDHIIVERNNAVTMFRSHKAQGSETLLEMPDGWENARGAPS